MALSTLQPAQVVSTASGLTTAITAYTAGDMLGAEITVTSAASASGGKGVISSLMVQNSVVNSPVTGALDMRWFNAASTPAADNAANSWSDANSRLQVVGIQVSAPTASALNSVSYTGNLWLPYHCAGGTTSLFLNVICLGAPAIFTAATDLQYTFEIMQWV